MRVFAHRERPHPGAQLSLFETVGGWRYSLWATNLPVTIKGWRASVPTPPTSSASRTSSAPARTRASGISPRTTTD
jgi:hypothetical protein